MTPTEQGISGDPDLVQSIVADAHGKIARWFRYENGGLTEAEVQDATDLMFLHHLMIFALKRAHGDLTSILSLTRSFTAAAEIALETAE